MTRVTTTALVLGCVLAAGGGGVFGAETHGHGSMLRGLKTVDYTAVFVGTNATVPTGTPASLVFSGNNKAAFGFSWKPTIDAITARGLDEVSQTCGGASMLPGGTYMIQGDDDCFESFKNQHQDDRNYFIPVNGNLDRSGRWGTRNFTFNGTTRATAKGLFFEIGWKGGRVHNLNDVDFCVSNICNQRAQVNIPSA